MCLIIDANLAAETFPKAGNPCMQQKLREALFAKQARVVLGGALRQELLKVGECARVLRVLDQAGAVRQVSDDAVAAKTEEFEQSEHLTSNDPHVLALARVASVTLLCSRDAALQDDFRGPHFVASAPNRRTAAYTDDRHAHLIARHCRRRNAT